MTQVFPASGYKKEEEKKRKKSKKITGSGVDVGHQSPPSTCCRCERGVEGGVEGRLQIDSDREGG